MIIYLVFDNPKYAFSPIFCSIDITDFAVKHTDYEISVMLNVELDQFARRVFSFYRVKGFVTDWYIEQKEKGHIYIDRQIRTWLLIPTKQECYTFLAQNIV